jgi:hypothetical protein
LSYGTGPGLKALRIWAFNAALKGRSSTVAQKACSCTVFQKGRSSTVVQKAWFSTVIRDCLRSQRLAKKLKMLHQQSYYAGDY